MIRRTKLVAAYAGLIALQLGLASGVLGPLWDRLLSALWMRAEIEGQGWLYHTFWSTLAHGAERFTDTLGLIVACGASIAIAALVGRMATWRALRERRRDPLEALRSRPWATRLAAFAPALVYFATQVPRLLRFFSWVNPDQSAAWLLSHAAYTFLPPFAIALGLGKLGSMVMGELTEPLSEQSAAAPRGEGDIVFSAVAVTPRTRAAVGALAIAGAATSLWVAAAPLATLQKSPAFMGLMLAYVAAAAGAAWAFRRVSRVAIGIDGVYVGEAASVRFFAYREMDEARAAGADVELVRGGSAVLRLQLHGEDAGRRDEVLARIAVAIARARSGETRGAEALVQSMAARRRVAAAAAEPQGYREATLTREHLWELVEGSATDAPTRAAAAEALALGPPLDGDERSRLRIAASRVADPRLRVALGSLASDDEEHEDESDADVEAGRSVSG